MLTTEFLITSLIIVLIPGTGVIYTVSMGLFQGRRASIVAALGCMIGIIPHLLASLLGLAALLHVSALAFQIVKFIGVAYLFYLAWGMWKETGKLDVGQKKDAEPLWKIGLRAILINILNPKLSIFFLAFLPQFIPADVNTPLYHMLALSLTFMVMTLLVFMLYGFGAHAMRGVFVSSPHLIQRVQRSFACIFVCLGAKLALTDK